MKSVLAICALGIIGLGISPLHAEMSVEAARAAVAPFYKALNAEFAKDSPDLVRQATAPEFVSCRSNDICNTRDEVVAGIGARLASIPDLKWQIKEVLVSGNQVIVRGEATATAARRVHGRPSHHQILHSDVDRGARARRREDAPLLPHRRVDVRSA